MYGSPLAHPGARTARPPTRDITLEIAAGALLNSTMPALVARRTTPHTPPLIMFANAAFEHLTGYPLPDILGQPCTFLAGPNTAPDAAARVNHALVTNTDCDLEILHYHRDGTPFWNALTVSPSRINPADPGSFVVLMRDITARRRATDRKEALAERLRALAMSDPLTGIGNRRSFDAMLEREWRRASRNGTCVTLAMIDIDHFKSFNDHFGHPAGDACLRSVAQNLQTSVRRPADFLARYGGEEFAVLMPELDEVGATVMGQRLVDAVRAAAIAHPCQPLGRISISCGIVTATPGQLETSDQLISQADHALYEAKRSGRDCVHQGRPGAPPQR